jgi:hypothetical protein
VAYYLYILVIPVKKGSDDTFLYQYTIILLDYIGGLMVNYRFNVRSGLSEITANRNFQEACFDSIRAGNPLMFDVEAAYPEYPDLRITCLEYILDAVSSADSSTYTDIELFENLAHPTIDLNQNLCHIPRDNNTLSTCIPKIIESYIAVSTHGYRLENNNGYLDRAGAQSVVSTGMRKIVTKYPHLLQDTSCRRAPVHRLYGDSRDYLTCFEKILEEGDTMDFIDVNQMPDGFFDAPLCHVSDNSLSFTRCYDKIVRNAGSASLNPPNITTNSRILLHNMILSKKFERQLYTPSGECGDERICLEKILDAEGRSAIIKTLLDAYSDNNGILDSESELSPFSGKKCRKSHNESKYESCLNTATKTIASLFTAYNDGVKLDAVTLAERIATQPQFSDKCGSLKLLSLISTTDMLQTISKESASAKFVDKIANKTMSTHNYLEPLRMFECISDVSGKPHVVNGADYALELGIPVLYQTYRNNMGTAEMIKELAESPCVSIRTGESMPCLQKLTKELLIDYDDSDKNPGINYRSKSIIDHILNSSDPNAYKYIYPDGGTYFTDYLTESLFHAITVNASVSSEAIGILEHMIDTMAVHFAETGKRFDSDTYPRFGRIIDIIEEAPRRHATSSFNQKFERPSEMKNFLNNCFTHSKEDINKAIRSGLFEYGKQKSNIELLSQWFDEYKEFPEITGSIRSVMERTKKKSLMTFFKSYNSTQQGKPKKDWDIKITPQVERLFEDVYKKPMSEYFKPSIESRILYDELCFSNSKADTHDFLEEIYEDVEGNSKLSRDSKGIVGVYDVSVGATGMWGTDHILQYADAISRILYGSMDPIGSPYILRDDKMHPVPLGLIESVDRVSEVEFVGKRTDNVKGKLKMSVFPVIRPDDISDSPTNVVQDFRDNDNDFTVQIFYEYANGMMIESTLTQFKMLDALQKLPKKLKKNLQAAYPILFGQLDAVLAMEEKDAGKVVKPDISTYKMVISNKPVDIIRSSACQAWDSISCMTIFDGSHNMSLKNYLDGGSYIAYLTKQSEYEPQWLARLFMHKCDNCNCVSIQDRLRYYEIEHAGKVFPNWHILYDAVKTVLADKGVNKISSTRGCNFVWGENIRENIENNGDERCDDYMGEQRDECEEECESNCGNEDSLDRYADDVSFDVQSEIDDRVAKAMEDHTIINDDGEKEYDISESEIDTIREDTEQEVRDEFEVNLIDEKVQECKDGCRDNCEDVNDGFDCYDWLVGNDMLDDGDGGDVWTDSDYIVNLAKDSTSYKSILLERTGQMETSLAFVKPVSSVF